MSMNTKTTLAPIQQNDAPEFSWEIPAFVHNQLLPLANKQQLHYRLLKVAEISQEKATAYRAAMSNVLSIINGSDASVVYILSGKPDGIELYLGISQIEDNSSTDNTSDTVALLLGALEGNFPGIKLVNISSDDTTLDDALSQNSHFGCVIGVPSFNEAGQDPEQEDFQSIERLVNSLSGETWQLIIVAESGSDADIRQTLEDLYTLSTELSSHTKQSIQQSENSSQQFSKTEGESVSTNTGKSKTIGTNTSYSGATSEGTTSGANSSKSSNKGTSITKGKGTSDSISTNTGETAGTNTSVTTGNSDSQGISLTRERINKRYEEMQKHVSETMIERFQLGRSKGMFKTGIYLTSQNLQTYQRLSRSVQSIFQGNQASATPLQIHKMDVKPDSLADFLQLRHHRSMERLSKAQQINLLAHGVPYQTTSSSISAATWLNNKELALFTGLPSHELPGLILRKSVEFALNTGNISGESLALGHVIQHGRQLKNNLVSLAKNELNKHIFITGVTGAGKTTTCMKLLIESGLPFLVIEPAKTEYRALLALGHDVDYYLLGREDITIFRLNPFELISRKQNLSGHISTLTSTLTAVYPMEAAMPQLVEEAIIIAYRRFGWDIQSNENYLFEDPWAEESAGMAWPTFSDMIDELDALIKSKGMGKEFEEKYRGSLVARLTNLTDGVKGRMLNTRRSINFDSLLDRKVVIELEELRSEQDKALLMGLLITRLAECMKQRHRKDSKFQHLTLVEEAHRLLSKPEPGEADARKLGVDMFANLLAEVRKYGEGLIIADQIPNKLIADVIKNTNTKIVHRLFAADDRNTIGDSMGLSDEQKDFLPLLQIGETVIYCGGWHAPVRVQITEGAKTDGQEITEEKLQLKGQQQLWLQRKNLFPATSHAGYLQEQQFAFFIQLGTPLLNVFLQWKEKHDEKIKNNHIEILLKKYQKGFSNLQDGLKLDSAQIADLLGCLLLDSIKFNKDIMFDDGFIKMLKSFLLTISINPEDLSALKSDREFNAAYIAFSKYKKTNI